MSWLDSPGVQKLRVLMPFVYALGVFYGGVIDVGELPHTPLVASDKLLHAAAFMGLEILGEWALYPRDVRVRRWVAVLGSITVGGSLELVQAALPYRSADFWDLVADSVGAVMGALALAMLSRAPRALPAAPRTSDPPGASGEAS
ncbi:MAG: VanZ family protein [Myxococcota bacterium]